MEFDVVVVGAGPSGSVAAMAASKAGLKVLLLERGPEPGSKNVSGAMIRPTSIQNYVDLSSAPVDRDVKRVDIGLFSSQGDLKVSFRPSSRLVTLSRLKFDKWLAQQAENSGATLITKTTVTGIEPLDGKKKVLTDRGIVEAKSVILSEGANALISMALKIRPEFSPKEAVQAVKEVYSSTKDDITRRFGLSGDEGVAFRFFIDYPLPSAGFLYTYKDSISIGVGAPINFLLEKKVRPSDLLEIFKDRTGLNEIVKGMSLREYSAKIIPEQGFPSWKACSEGIYLTGDTIGLINPLEFNGIGPAIASGFLAGKSVANNSSCYEYEKSLYQDKEISEVIRARPLVRELLKPEKMSTYINLFPRLMNSWISGNLTDSGVRQFLPKIAKDLILSFGVIG
ncbi:NAD(P)/FAD-dependent oxidoreductase [Acidianus sp. RZ1]|uniref:NAD(P)/FAD-dependent oxidoreductase n=1 Tax=Acidianus sp. RZ1 TaxID=1540082 RepID=UPI001492927E|nr:NAD(P)/FAD-dependent oxidoreductase [Acidianus sp. RZ1]NON62728.1 NAD(P)/FAD-dependent oxidoreductase [Acidianus sp. RZ1]